ncbi:MAG: type IV pilus twitching motility protein PilT [Bacteroidota bacterium]
MELNFSQGDGLTTTVPDDSVGVPGRVLPESYYAAIRTLPSDLIGKERIRLMAERILMLPEEDVAAVRAIYRKLAYYMTRVDASDMDLGGPACNRRIWMRVDGFKKPIDQLGQLTFDESDALLLTMLTERQQGELVEHFSCDLSYTLQPEQEGIKLDFGAANGVQKPRRYRTTIYFDNQHLAVCMRMLAETAFPLKSLGFHPLIEQGLMFSKVRDGVNLVTGVTGSGKSTTLDAIIEANNLDFDGHILLVAKPIEYMHTSKRCIIRHREVGTDVNSFVDGMIQGLRQDPDIVVVGEMRDPETISSALEMADTGHKVFSTLHTASAVETIDRIVAEYPTDEQERIRNRLADVLRCIISQKLLPGRKGGRVLAKEVLWLHPPAKAAIKNGNVHEIYQMIWEGSKHGMITLEQDLFRLVARGKVTPKVALNYANNKKRLVQLMQQAGA